MDVHRGLTGSTEYPISPIFMPRLRRSRKTAYATVHFTSERKDGKNALCVYATCQFTDTAAGPIWGHGEASVRAALAELTRCCPCPATYHRLRDSTGYRLNR